MEEFESRMEAFLEAEGFVREECLGYHSNNAPDDADGFVKGELGVIFYKEDLIPDGDTIMEVMRDMRHGGGTWKDAPREDWCSWSQVRLPKEEVLMDSRFQRALAEAAGAMEALTWR